MGCAGWHLGLRAKALNLLQITEGNGPVTALLKLRLDFEFKGGKVCGLLSYQAGNVWGQRQRSTLQRNRAPLVGVIAQKNKDVMMLVTLATIII